MPTRIGANRMHRTTYLTRPRNPDVVPTLIDLLEHRELKDHAAATPASLGTEIADGLPRCCLALRDAGRDHVGRHRTGELR